MKAAAPMKTFCSWFRWIQQFSSWVARASTPAGSRGVLAPFVALTIGVVLLATGCASSGPKPARPLAPARPVPGSEINEINLVAMPMALSFSGKPGSNGIAVKIYLVGPDHPKPQPVRDGTIEVMMYEGAVDIPVPPGTPSRHQWSFPASELPAYAFTTSIGTGYSFALDWGQDRPRTDRITVIARYRPAKGQSIYSAASAISVGTQNP